MGRLEAAQVLRYIEFTHRVKYLRHSNRFPIYVLINYEQSTFGCPSDRRCISIFVIIYFLAITQKVIKIHIRSIYESDAEFSSATVNLNKLFSKMNSLYFYPKIALSNFSGQFFQKAPIQFY